VSCERLARIANERDAANYKAAVAATPDRLREAAFREREDGVVIFCPHEIARWNSSGVTRSPNEHPCFETLVRFMHQELDAETLALIRAELDKIIEWCMAPLPQKPDTAWRRLYRWLTT
jgi:hypothetical protein